MGVGSSRSGLIREQKLLFIFASNLNRAGKYLQETEKLSQLLKDANAIDDDEAKAVRAKETPIERSFLILETIYRNCRKRKDVFEAFCRVLTTSGQQAMLCEHMPGIRDKALLNVTFGNISDGDLEHFYQTSKDQGDPFSLKFFKETPRQDAIAIISEVISYTWRDFFRVIEPPFQDGEHYIQSIDNESGSFEEKARLCLEHWINENPSASILDKALDALDYLEDKAAAEDLLRRFSMWQSSLSSHEKQPELNSIQDFRTERTDESALDSGLKSRFDTPPTQPIYYSNMVQIEPSTTQTDITNEPTLDDGLERTSHMPHVELQSSCEKLERIEQAEKPDLNLSRTKEQLLESGFESLPRADAQEESKTKSLLESVDLEELRAKEKPWKQGRFSTVYRAHIKKRDYAVKQVLAVNSNSNKKAIRKELEAFANLKGCENIVTFYDMKWDNDYFYLLLEKCDCSLQDAIDEKSSLVPRAILTDMCTGLDFLHASDIIHKDLKPPNVLLSHTRSGTVVAKLADLGTSVCLDDHTSVAFTQSGTDGWRAPEAKQQRGKKEDRLRPSYDVYCLGLVNYFTATGGEHPFNFSQYEIYTDEPNYKPSYDALKALAERRSEQPDSLSRYESASLLNLVMKMLSFHPSERPDMTRVKKHCFFWDWKMIDQFFFDKIWSDIDLAKKFEDEDELKAEGSKADDSFVFDDDVEFDSSAKGEAELDPKTVETMKDMEKIVEIRKEAKQRIKTLNEGWAKGDWTKVLDDETLHEMAQGFRSKFSISGFIIFMRNKVVHWQEDTTDHKKLHKELPYKNKKEALEYFLNCYPDLLPKVYEVSEKKFPHYLCL